MSELGQLLRKARLEKGISLEDMQETTKIRKRYLEAIEDGNYKLLPGNFYVRAFIKSYSESVGLDPNEVLRLYRNVIPAQQVDSNVEPNHRKRSGIKTNDRWSKRITTLVFVTFLVLIIVLVYYFTDKNSNITDNTYNTDEQNRLTDKAVDELDPNATPLATIEPNTPTPQASVLNPLAEVKLVSSTNGVDYYTISNATQIELQLSVASDKCWFEIDEVNGLNNKKLIETGNLEITSGKKTWTLKNPVYLKLGRANAAEVKVNGIVIPVGDLPNVKKFQFDLA